MTLALILFTLIAIGLLLWLINNFLPMDGKLSASLNLGIVAGVVLWLLYGIGMVGHS